MVWVYCPGCKHAHQFEVPRWKYNGSADKPTFTPSLRNYYVHPNTKKEITMCHFNLKNGVIEFCDDCEHDLRSQKVPLPDFPEGYDIPNSR